MSLSIDGPHEPEADSTYSPLPSEQNKQGGHFASFINSEHSRRDKLRVPDPPPQPPASAPAGEQIVPANYDRDARDARAILQQFLAEFQATSAEYAARTETRFLRSLEALEARIALLKNETNESRTHLDSLNSRLDALARNQREIFQATSQLASRLDDHVLPSIRRLDAQIVPAVKQLESRIADLHQESADGRRSVGDTAALFSKGLKELTGAERAAAEEIGKGMDQTRQMRSELSSKAQTIQSTVNGRMDSLEKKVDANARTSLNHLERLVEALELLEHKFSSILHSLNESKAQTLISAKRSDDRILGALEVLERAIGQLERGDKAPAFPLPRLPRRDDRTRDAGDSDSTTGQREERLVALMLDKDSDTIRGEQSP